MSRLGPMNDFIFKKIFGEVKNEDLLKDLLESILTDMKIEKVEINNDVSLSRKEMTDKLGILDIVATLNDNKKVNIEMQVRDYYNTVDKSVFYGTGEFNENLDDEFNYVQLPQSISIWITNYNIFEDGPFHERARLRRDFQNKLLSNKLEFHYIQIPKFKEKCKRITSKLDQWLAFIINENVEAIKMCDNDKVKKAEEELEYLTGDDAVKRLAYIREKGLRDERAAIAKATREGKELGLEAGIKAGKLSEKKKIAKTMKKEGFDISLISKITNLNEDEIKKL